MAKNTLADLNDHLFRAMARLSDGTLEGDDLLLEIKRANAVSNVSREIIGTQKLVLDAYKTAASLGNSKIATAITGKDPGPFAKPVFEAIPVRTFKDEDKDD
ncbi:MAG: hypothetical protein LBT40_15910 [Deltaproteobacteria bacterium]|jgi:hypothetical protein|nr:hypothetical protein [Deltaproteobacteria bacterium]